MNRSTAVGGRIEFFKRACASRVSPRPVRSSISANLSQCGEVPLRIYPGGIETKVAWHEVPGKENKDRVQSRRDG
jgi:hypothetical protein